MKTIYGFRGTYAFLSNSYPYSTGPATPASNPRSRQPSVLTLT